MIAAPRRTKMQRVCCSWTMESRLQGGKRSERNKRLVEPYAPALRPAYPAKFLRTLSLTFAVTVPPGFARVDQVCGQIMEISPTGLNSRPANRTM